LAFCRRINWIVESGAAPHPSLSPEYRGEGPRRRALANGMRPANTDVFEAL